MAKQESKSQSATQILRQAVSDNYRQSSYHLKGTAVAKQNSANERPKSDGNKR